MHQIDAIFAHIKDEDLSRLASKLSVDKCNTKIVGSLMFKGLMRLILRGKKTSLRMLAMIMNQDLDANVTYSGLSKRLRTLNPKYFQIIYENLIDSCSSEFQEKDQKNLHRFDSTIVALLGRLVQDGLKIGGDKKDSKDTHIKVSFGLKNQLPTSIRFCTEAPEINENIALVKAINEAKIEKDNDVLLFDRGLTKADALNDLCEQEYKFVTRINTQRLYEFVRIHQELDEVVDGNHYKEDIIVRLYTGKRSSKSKPKTIKNDLRLIKMVNSKNEHIWFLTNLFDLSAKDVADMYKRRWDIEAFFKFLKQNLGYKHFISHSLNGMKVYIYMILITTVLFLLYKKRNNRSGFQVPLFEFSLKVDKSFIKDLIVLSGGDPTSPQLKGYFD